MAGGQDYSPYLIVGKLTRDFILTEDGKDINDIPGGHLLYSAIGMTPWERHPGLVSKAGRNFPSSFIEKLNKYEFNTHGIKVLDRDLEHRNFISFFEPGWASTTWEKNQKSVLSQYFHAGKPFPKELLGYNGGSDKTDSLTERTGDTMLARDIPQDYMEARCIHLCPMDFITHNLLPQAFSGEIKRTITISAGDGYMHPYFFDAIKTLIMGLTGFIVREKALHDLFSEKYRIRNIEDMMKILLDYGAENIVVRTEDRQYLFINRVDQRVKRLKTEADGKWEKIGELSCFCGAYIVGLNETYDYQKAAAYGAARASLLKNEINPYNNLNVFSSLLNEKIRIMENQIEG